MADENDSRILGEEIETYPIVESLYEVSVKIASTRFGQFLIRKTDKVLRTFEYTAKWSLPQETPESESEKSLPPPTLIRPLPWILFIPALIALRLLRIALSFAALMLAQEAITPLDIVRFAQIRRRKLRAIKYQGLRQIRSYNNNENCQNKKFRLIRTVYGILNRLICSRNEIEETIEIIVTNKNQSSVNNEENCVSKKRNLNQVDDDSTEETDDDVMLYQLLDKSLPSDSSDDSNFEINDESESDESIDEESDTEDAIATKYSEQNNKISSSISSNCIDTVESDKSNENNKIETNHKLPENEINHNSAIPVTTVNCNSVQNQKVSPKIGQNGGFDDVKVTNNAPEQYTNSNNKAFLREDSLTIPPTIYGSNPEDIFYSPIGSPIPGNETEQFNENTEIYEMTVDCYDNQNNIEKIDKRSSSATSTISSASSTTSNQNIKQLPKNNFHTNLKQNNRKRTNHNGNKKSNKKN